MKRRRAWVGVALLGVAFALLFRTCLAAPLAPAPAYDGALPEAHPPAEMSVHRIATGYVRRQASSAYRGGAFLEERNSAVVATLVRHPKGDLLIDTGFGREIDAQFQQLPWSFRAITSYVKEAPAVEQLAKHERPPKGLRILLTHAHWDHASAIADFPNASVMMNYREKSFVEGDDVRTVILRGTRHVRYEMYSFTDGPYLGFAKSYDVYRDGSVVIVECPGHTPGSVIVFVTTPSKRYAFIGDLAWQREGIEQREERPWFWRRAVDSDEVAVREGLIRVSSLKERFPELAIIPAHDGRAFEEVPAL